LTDAFTPTTEQVRDALRIYRVRPEEFDRWLSQVKAEAKAEQREADAQIALGESEHLRDAATCRDIAAAIRAASETEGLAPARLLRGCTICGEKTTMSNATPEWEKRHEHREADHD